MSKVLMRFPTTRNSNAGIVLVVLSAVSFGVMPIFAKLAYEQMDFPQGSEVKTLLAIRFCLAAVCMWLLWAWQRRTRRAEPVILRPATLIPLVAMGALGYVGQSFSYFTAIGIISASTTGLLLYTYPMLVTLMAWLFYREALTARRLAALVLATLGALMVLGVLGPLLGLGDSSLGVIDPIGAVWGISAAVIYSVYIIAGTRFTAGVPPIFASTVIISSATVVYTVWGTLSGELRLDIGWEVWLLATAIAVVCTAIAIVTFFAGLKLVGPSRAAIASTFEPAVTVLLAALILQERITPEQIVGGALVLLSVMVLQWPTRPQVQESAGMQ